MTPLRPEEIPVTPKALAEELVALLEQQVPSAAAAMVVHAHSDELAATIQGRLEALRPQDLAALAATLKVPPDDHEDGEVTIITYGYKVNGYAGPRLWVWGYAGGPVGLIHVSEGITYTLPDLPVTGARKLGRLLLTVAYYAEHGVLPPWASEEGEMIVREEDTQ